MKINKVEDTFNIVDWCILVDALVDGHFDDNGEYVPHIGYINELRLFYNLCIKDCDCPVPHNTDDIEGLQEFVNDDEFLVAFQKSRYSLDDFSLSFGNACMYASDIIEHRRDPRYQVLKAVKDFAKKLGDGIKELATDENLDLLKELSGGKIDIDAIKESLNVSEE